MKMKSLALALEMEEKKEFVNPASAVDLIIQRDSKILLIKRLRPPFQGMWALPGGYLNSGQESLEQAAIRELYEETGLRAEESNLYLTGAYSRVDRDPRGHVISHAYYVARCTGELRAGDDAKEARWFPVTELPKLAFDHEKIIQDYKKIRKMGFLSV
jgi:8-oxo-dGTP diphosphatase